MSGGPGQDVAIDTEIQSVEKLLRDDRDAYFRDGHDVRYRRLLEAQAEHGPWGRAPKRDPRNEELRAIEKAMRTGEYSKDEAMQARYRELLRGPNTAKYEFVPVDGKPADTIHDSEEDGQPDPTKADGEAGSLGIAIPSTLQAEWGNAAAANAQQVNHVVGTLYQCILDAGGSEDDLEAFNGTARHLSEGVRTSVYKEVAIGAPTFAPLATPDRIAAYRNSAGGDVFVDALGSDAARRLGILDFRMDRLTASLSPAAQDEFWQFLDGCTLNERFAVAWVLMHQR